MRIELLAGGEQVASAGAALVHAGGLGIPVFAGVGAFGSGFAQDLVLLGSQFLAPLIVCLLYGHSSGGVFSHIRVNA